MSQSETRSAQEIYLVVGEPPSSPPIKILLPIRIMKQVIEVIKNSMTEKPKSPDGTW